MDFLNNIEKETIIVCEKEYKNSFLRRTKLLPTKFLTFEEFNKLYQYDYNELTIKYIMDLYHVKYEIAKEYIDNTYYVENIIYKNKKLSFLKELKDVLRENNLLIYNNYFKNYIKTCNVIFYDIYLDNFWQNLLKDINYKVINPKYNIYPHNVIEFNTEEEEIEYVAIKINELIYNGININNIKLTNINSEYYTSLERIFNLYNLKINIPYKSSLYSYKYIKDFIEDYLKEDLEEAINKLDKSNPLYAELIKVINKNIIYNNKDIIINCIKNDNIESTKWENAIEIIDYMNYQSKDSDYIFMLNFNDRIIPKTYKDTEYLNDNLKVLLKVETSKEKNIRIKEKTINIINNIKNLEITYKLKDNKQTYYKSTLCDNYNVLASSYNPNISYSEKYNQIKLTKSIDAYLKYGEKSKDYDLLTSNFSIRYNKYDNKFKGINRYFDKLTLSYSKMNIYNKCAFRYFLEEILKLNIFEENFSVIIGSMIHYVLENTLKNNDLSINKYVEEFLKDKSLNSKELFFLNKYISELENVLTKIKYEKEHQSFTNAMYEKKVEINLEDNIKFEGIIDKVLYKEEPNNTIIALVDYKTGLDDISLKYLKYGINIQLPIYLYLSDYLDLFNPICSGFYLQKINPTIKDYRLEGYTNSDKEIIKYIDDSYDNSSIIKGMKTKKDGSFYSTARVLNNDELNNIKNEVKKIIKECIENIKNNNFPINPKKEIDKNISCEYCKFKDICFVKNNDYINIDKGE